MRFLHFHIARCRRPWLPFFVPRRLAASGLPLHDPPRQQRCGGMLRWYVSNLEGAFASVVQGRSPCLGSSRLRWATVRYTGVGGPACPGTVRELWRKSWRNFSSLLTECVHRIADKLVRVCGCAAALFLFRVQCRMNPCTLGWYLPLLVRDVPGALQPSDGDGPGALVAPRGPASQVGAVPTPRIQSGQRARGGPNSHDAPPEQGSSSTRTGSSSSGSGATSRDAEAAGASGGHGAGAAGPPDAGASASAPGAATWKELDAKFRRDLPDEAYVGRLAYRGLVMRACPAIHLLDGVETSAKEREKAEKLLASLGLGRDRVRGTGANAGAPASDGGTSATGDTAGGFTREKEKTKEGPRARVQ